MPNTYGLKKSEHFRQSYYIDCLMANGSYSYSYIITAEKGDKGKWIVFCEEHEPEDLHKSYPDTYPLEGFDTLKDAAIFCWEFVDDFYGLWLQNFEADSDQSTEDSTIMRIYLNYGVAIDVIVGGRARGNAFPRAINAHDGGEFLLPLGWIPEERLWDEVTKWATSEGHSLTRPVGFRGPR